MNAAFFSDILVVFALSIGIVLVCHRLRIPSIVGFFLTGILAGPHALGLVSDAGRVEVLAEVGVVALLFTVGIGFSLERLIQIKRAVLLGGSVQVVLTALAGFLIARVVGLPAPVAVFAGFLLAHSSTTISLKSFQDRNEADTLAARATVGISIFQDIMSVPMLFLVPLLAGKTADSGSSFLIMAAEGLAVIVIVVVSAKWVVPFVLFQVTRTRSRELFLFSTVAICLAVTALTYSIGLSPALGAFLAGIIISESEYSQQALGDVMPFRDIFSNFFFVSIGMLLDVGFLWDHIGVVVALVVVALFAKILFAGAAAFALGFPLRVTTTIGLGLSNIGEFSFILAVPGLAVGLLSPTNYQYFLTVTVITMASTPFLITAAPHVADYLLTLKLPRLLKDGAHRQQRLEGDANLNDHLIIVGYGVNGRNIASAAAEALIPYVIIEMNPETVRRESGNGESILFGDGSQRVVLEHAGVMAARVLVAATPDAASTRRIIETARGMNPGIYLIARTRFVTEVAPLYKLGADEVIPEEFETSVEIFSRVLSKYLIPREQIENFIRTIRAGGYDMFRTFSGDSAVVGDLQRSLQDAEVNTFQVEAGCRLDGRTLAELDLRGRTGVTILGIRRGDRTIANPGGSETLHAGDILMVLGPHQASSSIAELLQSECAIL